MTLAHMGWDSWGNDLLPGPLEWIWGLLAFVLTVAFWVLVGYLLLRLLRRTPGRGSRSNSSGLSVLEERYARGEIAREEYFERRSVLLGETPPSPGPESGLGPTGTP